MWNLAHRQRRYHRFEREINPQIHGRCRQIFEHQAQGRFSLGKRLRIPRPRHLEDHQKRLSMLFHQKEDRGKPRWQHRRAILPKGGTSTHGHDHPQRYRTRKNHQVDWSYGAVLQVCYCWGVCQKSWRTFKDVDRTRRKSLCWEWGLPKTLDHAWES